MGAPFNAPAAGSHCGGVPQALLHGSCGLLAIFELQVVVWQFALRAMTTGPQNECDVTDLSKGTARQ